MKDVVEMFIDRFGIHGRVHYSLLTFGNPPEIHLEFSAKSNSSASLRSLIQGVPKPATGVALAEALRDAKMLFSPAAGGRKDAKRILVVIIDKESDDGSQDVREAAKGLEDGGVRVIAVALGDEDNFREVEAVVGIEEDAIKPNDTDSPRHIANTVIDHMLNGKSREDMISVTSEHKWNIVCYIFFFCGCKIRFSFRGDLLNALDTEEKFVSHFAVDPVPQSYQADILTPTERLLQ